MDMLLVNVQEVGMIVIPKYSVAYPFSKIKNLN